MGEAPRRLQFDNSIFVREETNGVSVHEADINTIKFLEDVPFEDFAEVESRESAAELLDNLVDEGNLSKNVELTRPLRVNWLASLACNLVCVYCYAEDKMDQKRPTAPEVFEGIHELNPLSISITGGEPLMSPYMTEALKEFSGRYGIILDTNGTVRVRDETLEALKEANATVRVTIDSINKQTLNDLRPLRSSRQYEPQKILDTITSLNETGVRTAVHTVVTSQNLNQLSEVGNKLIDMGIKTWQLYPVEYTEKYKSTYPSLRITREQILEAREKLETNYQDSIYVRLYDQREPTDGRSVVMMNNNGDITFDNINGGLETVEAGDDFLNRVMGTINGPQHAKEYLYSPSL